MIKNRMFLFLIGCLSFFANAQVSLVIYTEQFPPYNFADGDDIKGINVELVQQVCQAISVDCQFKLMHWNRAYRATLSDPWTGLVSTSRTAERESFFHWVGPLVRSQSKLFRLKSRPHITATSLKQANEFSIAAPRSDIYEKVLLEHGFIRGITLLSTSSKYEDVQFFLEGKLDLLISAPLVLPYQLQGFDVKVTELVPILDLNIPELKGNHLALNKSVPLEFVVKMQQALDELKARGLADKITQRYQQSANNDD